MSSITNYPHIGVNEDGSARVGSSRYKVIHLAAEHYHYGWSAEELLRQHPDLKPEEVYAALTYFYDHYETDGRRDGQSSRPGGAVPRRKVFLVSLGIACEAQGAVRTTRSGRK